MSQEKTQAIDIKEEMRKKGFLPAQDVAKRVGVSHDTVHKWKSAGKVIVQKVHNITYVRWDTVIRHIGVEQAVLLKIVKPEDAHKYK